MSTSSATPPSPPPSAPKKGSGASWAVAMALLGLACLVLPIVLIRSAMTRVKSLGGTAESALIAIRKIGEGFETGKVETVLRSYATSVRGVSRLQFAELRQLESFERTDSTALAWGAIPLPDVVVEARGNVVYSYVLDFQKRWDLKYHDGRVDVLAPAPEFTPPALDPSSLVFEVKKGSMLRDEEAVRAALQGGLTGLLAERARAHVPLVRETGRKATEEFVRNFLMTQYDDAADVSVHVRFADESAPDGLSPVAIERGPATAATPRR